MKIGLLGKYDYTDQAIRVYVSAGWTTGPRDICLCINRDFRWIFQVDQKFIFLVVCKVENEGKSLWDPV